MRLVCAAAARLVDLSVKTGEDFAGSLELYVVDPDPITGKSLDLKQPRLRNRPNACVKHPTRNATANVDLIMVAQVDIHPANDPTRRCSDRNRRGTYYVPRVWRHVESGDEMRGRGSVLIR